jgi:hypothetical protein
MRKLLSVLLVGLVCVATSPPAEADVASYGPGNAAQRILGQLRGANFNVTTDQSIPINAAAFQITSIVVTNCSVSMTLAAGGFYPAAGKGGTPIVAATQIYSGLTASNLLINPTIAATPLITRFTISTVFLSLTTAQGAAATCDVYVVGVDLS